MFAKGLKQPHSQDLPLGFYAGAGKVLGTRLGLNQGGLTLTPTPLYGHHHAHTHNNINRIVIATVQRFRKKI